MSKRKELDKYYTPEKTVRQLIKVLPFDIKGSVLDPFCGTGNIINCFNNNDTYTNDIDKSVEAHLHLDLSINSNWFGLFNLIEPDWIITNPPYTNAIYYVEKSVGIAKKGAIFLLRLSFLEPCKDRITFLQTNPPDLLVVTPRISFTDNGKTDSTTTAFFIFLKDTELKKLITNPFIFLSKG